LIKSENLKFEDAGIVYIDRRTLANDVKLMIKTIANHSKKSIDVEDVRAFFDRWPINTHDPFHICCGHDLAEIFGKSLQTLLGSKRAIQVDPSSIETALRLAYSFYDFSRTRLFKSIRKWEQRNLRACLRTA
jgi:hypothetical protein